MLLSSKLHGRNKNMAVNTWAVAQLQYGAGVLKWTTEELDRKTLKVITMYSPLHPNCDINRLYMSRGKGGQGLTSCKKCIQRKENSVGW